MKVKFPIYIVENSSNTHAITSSQDRFTIERPSVNSLHMLRANEEGIAAIVFSVDCVTLTGCDMGKIPQPPPPPNARAHPPASRLQTA